MADPNTVWTKERSTNVTYTFQVGNPYYIEVDPYQLCLNPYVIGQDVWTSSPSTDPSTTWTPEP